MGSDPRLGIPYPESNTANDVPKHIKDVVDKIGPMMAVDLQGTLAARPAAGVRGRYYRATDKKTLYRDDGTVWHQVSPGEWVDYTPAPYQLMSNGTGSGNLTIAMSSDAANRARYKIDGSTCRVSFRWKIWKTGGIGYEYGISLPVAAKYEQITGTATVENTHGFVITVANNYGVGGSGAAFGIASIRRYNTPTNLTPGSTTIDAFDIEYEIA